MAGRIHEFLARDHARLDDLLERALTGSGAVDYAPYAGFRAGLLRHIGMEEKILLPAARHKRGGTALPVAEKLRRDHGALAALLVPTPTRTILATVRKILTDHNALEEDAGGVYETCEELAGDEIEGIVGRLEAAPEVSLAKHVDGPQVMEAMGRALSRAGYELAEEE